MRMIAIIGASECDSGLFKAAETAGAHIAETGSVLLCGGLSGVMEAACRGAKSRGGITVGIIPGLTGENPYSDIVIRTGLGQARNAVLVQSAGAIVAIGGEYGTLAEIATALKMGKPVFGYRTWDIMGVKACESPEDAVIKAIRACDLSH
jgi:uncharacterized protein (TIGR00725 family)